MDMDFVWTTRDQKLAVVRYWWREQREICWICKDRENPMEPYAQAAFSPWAASIEHLIPKRDNGPDTAGNVRLAHVWCNNALGALWQTNRDREALGLPAISEKQALSAKRGALQSVDRAKLDAAEKAGRDQRAEPLARVQHWQAQG